MSATALSLGSNHARSPPPLRSMPPAGSRKLPFNQPYVAVKRSRRTLDCPPRPPWTNFSITCSRRSEVATTL
jgi:hypothetical protein